MKFRKYNPTWEHIKLLAWVILLFQLLLFCIALAVGRHTDIRFALSICLWLGLIVSAVFVSIFLLNLLGIVIVTFFNQLRNVMLKQASATADVLRTFETPALPSHRRQKDGNGRRDRALTLGDVK